MNKSLLRGTNAWRRDTSIYTFISWQKAVLVAVAASVPETTTVAIRRVKVPVDGVVGTWPGVPRLCAHSCTAASSLQSYRVTIFHNRILPTVTNVLWTVSAVEFWHK